MDIAGNIKELRSLTDKYNCTLVAVSKTKPEEDIKQAYDAGHLDFGENKAQELTAKYEVLPKDIRWHMIGHMQSNKVKYIAPFVHLIHSVDSAKLLKEVNKQGRKANRKIACLLQLHIAKEESKFGLSEDGLFEILNGEALGNYEHVQINGLMGMATFTKDMAQVRKEFKNLKRIFDRVKNEIDRPNVKMDILSMGMSGDFEVALEEGSNMIRVGSKIFGERNYQ
ncbi:MAG TPA: YggS family pyridoxal phosphate-dependent enzyme [Cytophagales bacterium]|jgi:pyridoxal phosphate enzyme (YggS family)|nr:YggS family pyridoxal phosphate-dependent enzyme [Cytophagales bacterium]